MHIAYKRVGILHHTGNTYLFYAVLIGYKMGVISDKKQSGCRFVHSEK
jgi:hypothetical protein